MWQCYEGIDPDGEIPDDEFHDKWAYMGHNPDDGMPMYARRDDGDRAYDEYTALVDSGVYRGT